MGMKDKAADVKTGKELKLVWNNARLNTLATYHTLVPGFERLLKQCGGDHEAFYKAVEGMKDLSNVERKRALGME
jgi:predicted aminopeptidase